MPSRRIIKSVLHNFLGTYTSRYSEFGGYWLFGFLVERMRRTTIDLLDTGALEAESEALAMARRLAIARFAEQLAKAGFARHVVASASLEIVRSEAPQQGRAGANERAGYEVEFVARAVSDVGSAFERRLSLFVAPHEPRVERRSVRGRQPPGHGEPEQWRDPT